MFPPATAHSCFCLPNQKEKLALLFEEILGLVNLVVRPGPWMLSGFVSYGVMAKRIWS
jgi:hypothetical protein